MNRPHAFIMKDAKIKFPLPPFSHPPLKMMVPEITIPIPLWSGHCCYLVLPGNYNKYDLQLVTTTLSAHLKYTMEAKEAFRKSVLGEYLARQVKKKGILQVHY